MQTRSRADGRDGERAAQQDWDAEGEREGVRLRGMWDTGRLDENAFKRVSARGETGIEPGDACTSKACCMAGGRQYREQPHVARQLERLEGLVAGSHTLVLRPQDTVDMRIRIAGVSGRTAGMQDCQPCMPCDPQIARRDRREEWPDDVGQLDPTSLIPYHWHTTNILCIQGRLPWIIPGRHA
jgi:hypothetical protein